MPQLHELLCIGPRRYVETVAAHVLRNDDRRRPGREIDQLTVDHQLSGKTGVDATVIIERAGFFLARREPGGGGVASTAFTPCKQQ